MRQRPGRLKKINARWGQRRILKHRNKTAFKRAAFRILT